jgi:hypothetical protein
LLFERGFVVLETTLAGSPLGSDDWAGVDAPISDLGRRVQELVDLDARNALVSIDEVSSAHLTAPRFVGSWVLRLSLRGAREMCFFWRRPLRTYARLSDDGTLETPRRRPAEALQRDLQRILGARLVAD